jgi:hypothetical protein
MTLGKTTGGKSNSSGSPLAISSHHVCYLTIGQNPHTPPVKVGNLMASIPKPGAG